MDKKTHEKKSTPIALAFEARRKNDEEGITEAIIERREKERENYEKFKEEAAGIIEKGGLFVYPPKYKKLGEHKILVGSGNAAVRLVREKSGKGNVVIRITDIAGEIDDLKVNQASPYDLRSFPQWFRDQVIRSEMYSQIPDSPNQ